MPQPGDVLGPYDLVEVIGDGSMGVVYRAVHRAIGRQVAVKILKPERARDPRSVERFFAEAQAVNRIRHPNIVDITDFADDTAVHKYCVMELLNGESLRSRLDREGFVPPELIPRIVSQIADALAAVHAAGVVHRDLKPDNIFLVGSPESPEVKLLDFGVAKLAQRGLDEGELRATRDGAMIGTPEYMSPEQLAQKPVDAATDIYALGLVWYEMITGQRPFSADSYGELVIKHITLSPTPANQLVPHPRRLSASTEGVLMACLAKDAEARPLPADIQRAALAAPVAIEEAPTQPGTDWEPDDEPLPNESRWQRAILAFAALTLLAGIVYWWSTSDSSSSATSSAAAAAAAALEFDTVDNEAKSRNPEARSPVNPPAVSGPAPPAPPPEEVRPAKTRSRVTKRPRRSRPAPKTKRVETTPKSVPTPPPPAPPPAPAPTEEEEKLNRRGTLNPFDG